MQKVEFESQALIINLAGQDQFRMVPIVPSCAIRSREAQLLIDSDEAAHKRRLGCALESGGILNVPRQGYGIHTTPHRPDPRPDFQQQQALQAQPRYTHTHRLITIAVTS